MSLVGNQKPSTVIAARDYLVRHLNQLWDTTTAGDEPDVLADWLLSHNYISNVLFEEVEGE